MNESLDAMRAALQKIESHDRRRETLDSDGSPKFEESHEKSEELLPIQEKDGVIEINYRMPSELARMVNVPSTISVRQPKSSLEGSDSFLRQRLSSAIRRRITLTFERCPR